MREARYSLEHGGVWYDAGGRRHARPVCQEGGLMALAFDADDDLIFLHGDGRSVAAWAEAEAVRRRPDGIVRPTIALLCFPAVVGAVEALDALVSGASDIDAFLDAIESLSGARPVIFH